MVTNNKVFLDMIWKYAKWFLMKMEMYVFNEINDMDLCHMIGNT